jgi:hypothetical protein
MDASDEQREGNRIFSGGGGGLFGHGRKWRIVSAVAGIAGVSAARERDSDF